METYGSTMLVHHANLLLLHRIKMKFTINGQGCSTRHYSTTDRANNSKYDIKNYNYFQNNCAKAKRMTEDAIDSFKNDNSNIRYGILRISSLFGPFYLMAARGLPEAGKCHLIMLKMFVKY